MVTTAELRKRVDASIREAKAEAEAMSKDELNLWARIQKAEEEEDILARDVFDKDMLAFLKPKAAKEKKRVAAKKKISREKIRKMKRSAEILKRSRVKRQKMGEKAVEMEKARQEALKTSAEAEKTVAEVEQIEKSTAQAEKSALAADEKAKREEKDAEIDREKARVQLRKSITDATEAEEEARRAARKGLNEEQDLRREIAALKSRNVLISNRMQVEGIPEQELFELRREQKSLVAQQKDMLRQLNKIRSETQRDIRKAKEEKKTSIARTREARADASVAKSKAREARRSELTWLTTRRLRRSSALKAQVDLAETREALRDVRQRIKDVKVKGHERSAPVVYSMFPSKKKRKR